MGRDGGRTRQELSHLDAHQPQGLKENANRPRLSVFIGKRSPFARPVGQGPRQSQENLLPSFGFGVLERRVIDGFQDAARGTRRDRRVEEAVQKFFRGRRVGQEPLLSI